MKRTRHYLPADSIFPFRGLDTLGPSTQLLPGYSPRLLNVEIDRGIVSRRTGIKRFANAVDGKILGFIEFEDINGDDHLVCVTTTKQYLLDGDTWKNITYQDGGDDVDWTGDEDDLLDYAIVTGLDGNGTLTKWLIITNGVDQPRYWDGAASTFALYSPNISDFVTCRTITSFYSHVILGNITTTTPNPQLVSWSDTNKLLDFTTANAGDALLTQAVGGIERFVPLGDRMVIYTEGSITMMSYVGGSAIFVFDKVLDELRLVSPNTIVNLGSFHIYATLDNIYGFDGSRSLPRLGDKIKRDYNASLARTLCRRSIAFHDSTSQRVHFVFPVEEGLSKIYLMEYDLGAQDSTTWTEVKYSVSPTTFGQYSQPVSLLWSSDSLNVPWDQLGFSWSDPETADGHEAVLMGSDGQAFKLDRTVGTDDGEVIEAFWDSPDFTVPGFYRSELARWLEIELDLQGGSVEVWYSLDEGGSYQLAKTLTLGTEWQKYTVFIDQTSRTMRVRLRTVAADVGFKLRWLRLWLRPGGAS